MIYQSLLPLKGYNVLYIVQNVPNMVYIRDIKFIFKNTCFCQKDYIYLELNLKLKHMSQNVIMAIVRHGLTFVGGFLIAKGVITEGMAAEVSGLVMTAVSTVWSIVEKIKSVK